MACARWRTGFGRWEVEDDMLGCVRFDVEDGNVRKWDVGCGIWKVGGGR